jgi:hypothetical protein
LDVKKIFKNKKFLELPENIIKRMNNWLETFYKIAENNLENTEEFFVEKNGEITNIVKYENWLLKAKRRI